MLIYSKHITPRLQYIVQFFSKELGVEEWQLTNDAVAFNNYPGAKINYSHTVFDAPCLSIIPQGLLEQTGIKQQNILVKRSSNIPVFFCNESLVGFDLFAASFYLLSRYEEYLPFEPDRYGRFPAVQSLAFKNGFLKKPLIHYWMELLKKELLRIFPAYAFRQSSFLFVPTYDIDMAWSYKHKGILRNGMNFLKEAISLQFAAFSRRFKVLTGREKDPFDQFGWLNHLHEQYHLNPYYFFLVAERTGKNDKNIPPAHPAMKSLIADHAIRYPVGLHPSWQSNKSSAILKKEKATLASITGAPVTTSRQHFLKLNLPGTYRNLLEAGIGFDCTMGYADENGFRASAATPFYWYDLEKETATSLLIFPFCFMEATSIFYKKETPAEALTDLRQLYNEVKQINGFFSMIWHNHSFSDEGVYAGWKAMYEQFIATNTLQDQLIDPLR
ncbi:hypothetical protein A8C56_18485 [Niabella ginsenosidivorans]|uniref:DUF7033 domain-containing protein n=1 Tax=Niabella ginsenosidivorans TaxID=1176587 RepID=A0A1A9I6M1_9BACT|nr:polysaccharide deacetylase family protein [Niabella ginsenosidivorans]ANH82699.1 hypothetical protein A8C56_18485 [Niabella ginsenosidivorans]